ncbi:uncharacterized protein CC84DRAFT_1205091 [Paraphaeosphaeria sporulosa]|uniref:Uncharacterized protein n=1 Tax=Paraphaeosphaeria sporulosa TaxID=1460663 RepID=A0A177CK40_9PLEO|nr:uncharacterized protein CC84DRAFT_1205091 [Paraphaeosphaeria sporulosa]OAG07676.1 hypothetical protein CC84DRAFT_1205091 [Paraphaeosphaeria sporulosa]
MLPCAALLPLQQQSSRPASLEAFSRRPRPCAFPVLSSPGALREQSAARRRPSNMHLLRWLPCLGLDACVPRRVYGCRVCKYLLLLATVDGRPVRAPAAHPGAGPASKTTLPVPCRLLSEPMAVCLNIPIWHMHCGPGYFCSSLRRSFIASAACFGLYSLSHPFFYASCVLRIGPEPFRSRASRVFGIVAVQLTRPVLPRYARCHLDRPVMKWWPSSRLLPALNTESMVSSPTEPSIATTLFTLHLIIPFSLKLVVYSINSDLVKLSVPQSYRNCSLAAIQGPGSEAVLRLRTTRLLERTETAGHSPVGRGSPVPRLNPIVNSSNQNGVRRPRHPILINSTWCNPQAFEQISNARG